MASKHTLHLVSRPASASPAVGYYAKHNAQQRAVIEGAFGVLGQDQAPRF
jgi:2-oxoglutarate dehydrogenase E1 component